jgi:SAM-dependent methyltransferase
MSAIRLPQVPRVEESEWLDQGRGSDADVAANLDEMWRLNRWLGGMSALTQHLYPRLRSSTGPCTVLDLGTGSAQVPLAIARWASEQHVPVSVYGLDWSARNLAAARRRAQGPEQVGPEQVGLVLADARRPPLAERAADFVISSLFVHHFAPEPAVELLHTAYGVTRRALIMTDLVRGILPWLAFGVVQPVLARHPLTRHDGDLSIRRAYTPAELRGLAAAAGLTSARVYAHWPWRMTLVVDRAANA